MVESRKIQSRSQIRRARTVAVAHSDDDEILDVVNESDEVIDVIKRGDTASLRSSPGRFIRAVEMFIQRSNGDIYLPRRSTDKKVAPGGLDLSVAGHLNSGETYDQACIREIKEEAGIDATIDQLILFATVRPSDKLLYFRNIYLFRTDIKPRLSSEHTEAIWASPDQLEDVIRNDIPTKETLYEDITLLLNYLKENG